jgi:hypothetical protein
VPASCLSRAGHLAVSVRIDLGQDEVRHQVEPRLLVAAVLGGPHRHHQVVPSPGRPHIQEPEAFLGGPLLQGLGRGRGAQAVQVFDLLLGVKGGEPEAHGPMGQRVLHGKRRSALHVHAVPRLRAFAIQLG